MAIRILSSFIILFSLLFLPFWVSIILTLSVIIYFRVFIEAFFLFLFSDLFFGIKEVRFFDFTLFSAIAILLLLIIIELIKRRLMFYKK